MAVGVAEVAALVTVAAASIYVLGLVALGWTIYRTITLNSYGALYALAVIPRMVVAAQGLRWLVIGFPPIWSLLMLASVYVGHLVYTSIDIDYKDFDSILGRAISMIATEFPVVASIAMVLLLLGLLEVTRAAGLMDSFVAPNLSALVTRVTDPLRAQFRPSIVLATTVSSIGGVAGGLVLVVHDLSWESGFQALVIVFFTHIAANMFWVLPSVRPQLPQIHFWVDGQELTGHLLGHSDGHWYIFDDRYTTLHSIPLSDAVIHYPYTYQQASSSSAQVD